MGQHYIYKYVYEDEIIYIGKTDNRPLSCRIKEHAKEPKFKPFLEGCKIYYFETIHQTENGLFESCLIDRYKPRLNVIDNHPEGVGRFNNIEEPEWKPYKREDFTRKNSKEKMTDNQKKPPIKKPLFDYSISPFFNSQQEYEDSIIKRLNDQDDDIKKMASFLLVRMKTSVDSTAVYKFNEKFFIEWFGLSPFGTSHSILNFLSDFQKQTTFDYQTEDYYDSGIHCFRSISVSKAKKEAKISFSEDFFRIVKNNLDEYENWAKEVLREKYFLDRSVPRIGKDGFAFVKSLEDAENIFYTWLDSLRSDLKVLMAILIRDTCNGFGTREYDAEKISDKVKMAYKPDSFCNSELENTLTDLFELHFRYTGKQIGASVPLTTHITHHQDRKTIEMGLDGGRAKFFVLSDRDKYKTWASEILKNNT